MHSATPGGAIDGSPIHTTSARRAISRVALVITDATPSPRPASLASMPTRIVRSIARRSLRSRDDDLARPHAAAGTPALPADGCHARGGGPARCRVARPADAPHWRRRLVEPLHDPLRRPGRGDLLPHLRVSPVSAVRGGAARGAAAATAPKLRAPPGDPHHPRLLGRPRRDRRHARARGRLLLALLRVLRLHSGIQRALGVRGDQARLEPELRGGLLP